MCQDVIAILLSLARAQLSPPTHFLENRLTCDSKARELASRRLIHRFCLTSQYQNMEKSSSDAFSTHLSAAGKTAPRIATVQPSQLTTQGKS